MYSTYSQLCTHSIDLDGRLLQVNEDNDNALLWVNHAGHMLALNKGEHHQAAPGHDPR